MTAPAIELDRLLKLRLTVARFGEMDVAKWWNTRGQLGHYGAAVKRGFPRTHYFAQARSVFAVAAHRCEEVFTPLGCATLWRLTEPVEEAAGSEAQHVLSKGGLGGLSELADRIDGLVLGPERRGAGTGLADLARFALQQVSALSAVNFMPTAEIATVAESAAGGGWLESKIRQVVVGQQPKLGDRFRRQFRRSQSSRPLRYGFVGKFIVANFATLQSKSSSQVSAQVDRAKARLWDLHQFDAGVLADSLQLHAPSMSYELLVHRPIVFETRMDGSLKSSVKAAEEELEAEADKFHIRFRPLRSVDAIAEYLIEREAA